MSFTPIRERDANGALIKAGYRWLERRDGPLAFIFLMVIGVAIMCVGIAGTVPHTPEPGLIIIGFGALLLTGSLYGFAKWRIRERSLYFDADGKTFAPAGLPDYPDVRELKFRPPDIASIEVKHDYRTYSVVLITGEGEEFRLAIYLIERDARLVSVQLNLALTEIRMTIGGKFKIGNVEVVID